MAMSTARSEFVITKPAPIPIVGFNILEQNLPAMGFDNYQTCNDNQLIFYGFSHLKSQMFNM